MHHCRRVSSIGLPLLILLLLMALPQPSAFAAAGPTIKVVSPVAGSTGGYPTYYEAYSYSTTCTAGISAMRVYSSVGVPALTVESSHISAFVGLPAGSDDTTIVAWDNCGGSSAVSVPITINPNPGIVLYLPSGSSAGGPLHIVAGAHTTVCANDINSMRIYTAPGVAPYSVFGNQLDAFLTLAPGTYNIVVQAWDNCGNVLKYSFPETVTEQPDKFLYSTGGSTTGYNTNLIVFPLANGKIGKASGLLTNTGTTSPLQQILVDPSGYFLYATDGHKIFAYDIDRYSGTLQPAPGSPYAIESSATLDISLALDPNGHFLYVSDPVKKTLSRYTIYRSDGSLTTYTGDAVPAPGGYVVMNYTGSYVFETSYYSGATSQEATVFSVDQTTGLLTQTESYNVPDSATALFPPTIAWKYLYLPQRTGCCGEQTFAYEMESNGGLTAVPGSPFAGANDYAVIGNAVADWLTRYYWYPGTNLSNDPVIQTSDIVGGTGALGENIPTATGNSVYEYLAEDHSGQYLYSAGLANQASSCNGTTCSDVFASWSLGSNGEPVALSGPVASGFDSTSGAITIATSR
jgi:hypothetical protein